MGGIVMAAYADEGPVIVKRGTVECDLVEASPVVFKGVLYRFEYVRDQYKQNTTGDSYLHFRNAATGERTPAFGAGFHLASAFVDGDTMYVYAVSHWGEPTIQVFWSEDLETWKSQAALHLPNWGIYNTAVCKTQERYVMAFEVGEPPEEVGERFTLRFAYSDDARTWTLTPSDHVYSREKYTACPALRYLDGEFYMVYLEAYPGPTYAPHIIRSSDLVTWEDSPFNPIMTHSDEDKRIANPTLTEAERAHIAGAENVNNSDVDFCEHEGKTIITYAWGNQRGIEFLAEAEYNGPEADFLRAYFPER
jgi:hypothetical protein